MKLENFDITVFGDSIAKGCYIEKKSIKKFENSFISLIEKKIDQKINNISCFGQTLKRLINKKEIEKLIDKTTQKQKLAFFCIGGNDSDYNWKDVEETPQNFHFSKTPLEDFIVMFDESIKKLQNAGVLIIISTIVPLSSEKYFFNVIKKQFNKKKILKFLGDDVSNIARHQEIFSTEVLKLALKNNCHLLDIRKALLDERFYLKLMCEDGVHPNIDGHKLIADYAAQQIELF